MVLSEQDGTPLLTEMTHVRMTAPGSLSAMYTVPVDVSMAMALGADRCVASVPLAYCSVLTTEFWQLGRPEVLEPVL